MGAAKGFGFQALVAAEVTTGHLRSHIEEEIEQKQSNGCRDVLAMSKLREKTYHTSSSVKFFVLNITQVLEHFQREAEKKELKNKLQALLDDQNASTEEIFNALRFCIIPYLRSDEI